MNINEFAEKIGVSVYTVSCAISGRGRVSSATRRMVLQRMQELGYKPNRVARALATGRSQIIAFFAPGPHLPQYAEMSYYIKRRLKEHDYEMITVDLLDYVAWGGSESAPFLWPVDGSIIVNSHLKPQNLENTGPVVSMGVYHMLEGDYVGIEIKSAVKEAVQHLKSVGCRRIAYLVGQDEDPEWDPRFGAYIAVADSEYLKPEYITVSDSTRRGVYEMMCEYLQHTKCPDGIFCRNDDAAIGVNRALQEAGLRVPEDVALIGCDGIEDTEYTCPPITTIVTPHQQMCERAVDLLLNRLDNPNAEIIKEVIHANLVIRGSSLRLL